VLAATIDPAFASISEASACHVVRLIKFQPSISGSYPRLHNIEDGTRTFQHRLQRMPKASADDSL
jgi:hypothetical protein